MKSLKLLLLAGTLMMYGCSVAEVKVEVLSERTTLENQILGTYNSLDDDMLLAASVRGVDPKGNIKKPRPHSREYRDALSAMQILDFHADDVYIFKQIAWVGENNQGLIEDFGMKKENIPDEFKAFAQRYKPEEFKSVIATVNDAREVIMSRVIETNENLTEADLPEIRKIFGKLNAESASKGEKIQLADGTWTVKN